MGIKGLTHQENKIAGLTACGLLGKEIASKLYLSPFTVATHLRNIRRKTAANNIADVTRLYILSLPKPTDVFKVLMFLFIQVGIIVQSPDMDLRRSRRNGSKIVRVVRKAN